MMFSSSSEISFILSSSDLSSKTLVEKGERGEGKELSFARLFDRLISSEGAGEEKETSFLDGVLENLRERLLLLSEEGGDDFDLKALSLIRKMIAESGLDDELKGLLLEDMESGEISSLSFFIEKLELVIKKSSFEDELFLYDFSFLYSFFYKTGFTEDKSLSLIESTGLNNAGNLSLDLFKESLKSLKDDLLRAFSEGRTYQDTRPDFDGERALLRIQALSDRLNQLQDDKDKLFLKDTASILREALLNSLKPEDSKEIFADKSRNFDLYQLDLNKDKPAFNFLRDLQGKEEFSLFKEKLFASDYKDVAGDEFKDALSERQSYGAKLFERSHFFKKEVDKNEVARAFDSFERELKNLDFQDGFSGGGGGEAFRDADLKGGNGSDISIAEKTDKNARISELPFSSLFLREGFTSSETRESSGPNPPLYVLRQLSEKLSEAVKNGQDELSFQLKPENLGRLHLRIERAAGVLNIRILAEKKSSQELLNSQLAELKAQMQEQGFKVEKIELSFALDFDLALFREKERERESRRPRQEEVTSGEEREKKKSVRKPSGLSLNRGQGLNLLV